MPHRSHITLLIRRVPQWWMFSSSITRDVCWNHGTFNLNWTQRIEMKATSRRFMTYLYTCFAPQTSQPYTHPWPILSHILLHDILSHFPATPYTAIQLFPFIDIRIYSLLTVLYISILLHIILYSPHHPWPMWPLTLLATHPQPSHLPLPLPVYKSPCHVSRYHWWSP